MKFDFAYREDSQLKFAIARNTLQRFCIYYKTVRGFVNKYLEKLLDRIPNTCYFPITELVHLNPCKRGGGNDG